MTLNTSQSFVLDHKSAVAFFSALGRGEPKITMATRFLEKACDYFHLSREDVYKMLTGDAKAALKEIQTPEQEVAYLASHISSPYNWRIFLHYADSVPFSADLMGKWRDLLHVSDEDLRFMFSRSPRVFFFPISQVENTLKQMIEKFGKNGLTRQQFIKSALNNPAILVQPVDKMEKNIKGSVAFLQTQSEKFTLESYLQMAVKSASLFYTEPDILKRNFEANKAIFKKEGLSESDFAKVLFACPRLLEMTSQNILSKIDGAVSYLGQYGITRSQYLQMAIKQNSLFATEPERIKRNIQEVVEVYKKLGLDTVSYVHAVAKAPRLLSEPPQTIIPRIQMTVDTLMQSGMQASVNDALMWVVNNPKAIVFGHDSIQRRQIIALIMKDAGLQPKKSLLKSENKYLRDRICEAMKVSVGAMQEYVRSKDKNQKPNSKLENEAIIDALIQQKTRRLAYENTKQVLQWMSFYGKSQECTGIK